MAKEKKRGFLSWLGLGPKEEPQQAEPEQQIEPQPEEQIQQQAVVEQEIEKEVEAEAKAEPAPHSEAESEAFAADVVEVTEQVVAREEVAETAPEAAIEEPAAPQEAPLHAQPPVYLAEEALPQAEEVAPIEPEAEEWLTEDDQRELTDEELEAAALSAPAEEEIVLEEEPVEVAPLEQEKPTKEGFFARLKRSLLKTKENLGSGFISLFRGKKIDDDLFEELEEQLLVADVGVETTRKIIATLTESASRKQLQDAEALYGLLKAEMGDILAKVDAPLNIEGKTPFVILMVGVNGVGKTTTIGKLARQFEQQGKSVMLAAGDTFRAAAVEQLQVWGQRNNIPVIAQHTGADSASVIFDAIQAAKSRGVDVLIADTAGRLQNKAHLMEELKKIVRVMKKLDVDAPHEVMLTIDASTGQNAVSQTRLFNEAVGLTGITLTKLDGTAKGGVIFSVADQFGIPIRYIGTGERIEDLRPFNAGDFIEALFARED
ncbi:signal recognition particle-docking protein FtsY [Pseudescherichia sp.]|uniref:signal recognition particle-docking protein FtsY n=1 Tax=Pseudescherichia sp. TaxID=2055881 RepID=UPI000E991B16|nr:signal recognition particle-docking protein FtsY [Pseudescherichia sp.]HAZ77114.1 signal recognition particle-docking protein FtsY [Enterobacteriaceae bacterium]